MLRCVCGYQGTARIYEFSFGPCCRCPGCSKVYLMTPTGAKPVNPAELEYYSFDELKYFTATFKGEPEKPPKKNRIRKGSRPIKDSAAVASSVDSKNIFRTEHYYLRENDSWPNVLDCAKAEREVRADTVLVFVHHHQLGADCSSPCREIK